MLAVIDFAGHTRTWHGRGRANYRDALTTTPTGTRQVRWQHFPRLARALQDFNPDPAATLSMISPFVLTNLPGHPDTDAMWKLLDYGKASQSVTELASTSGQGLSFTI
ncbi:hypothetical protein MY4038_002523 [Beauveria bassiana]